MPQIFPHMPMPKNRIICVTGVGARAWIFGADG